MTEWSADRSPGAAHHHAPRGDEEHGGEGPEDDPVGAGGQGARIAVRREQRTPEGRAALGEYAPCAEVMTDALEGPSGGDHRAQDGAGPRHEVHGKDGTRE